MKRIVFVVLFVGLSAFAQGGQLGQIQLAVKKTLFDPDSAKWGTSFVSKNGKRACINVNAKNKLGGYTGEKAVFLINGDSNVKWIAIGGVSQSGVTLPCSQGIVDYLAMDAPN